MAKSNSHVIPNDAAILRLVGTLALEQNDEWQPRRRYMRLDGLKIVGDKQLHRIFNRS